MLASKGVLFSALAAHKSAEAVSALGEIAKGSIEEELASLQQEIATFLNTPTDLTILLQGETGTGKDVLARHVHDSSGRSGSFVAINCAALPTTLAESELFGYVRGAFTGAERFREGVFEQAHRGTLFLDEVGDLDLAVQAKLLRVIEDGMVHRLGASTPVPVDVRIIAATHHDLQVVIGAGRFREDLFQRLAGVTMRIPPLRARREDIRPMVEGFIAEHGGGARVVPPDTMAWLERQPWRGNVRELRQAVRRAVALGGQELRPEDFTLTSPQSVSGDEPLAAWLAGKTWPEIEKEVIALALRRHGGLRAAAAALGRPKSTLADRARAHGLSVAGSRSH